MKLLLDTHMFGQRETGNERYWKNLFEKLLQYHKKNDNVFIHYIPKLKNGLYRILLGFNKATKAASADIVHVQNFSPLIKTVPIVNTIHDLCFKSHPEVFGVKSNLAFRYFFARSLELSDAIICVSKFTKQLLITFYKIDPKKIFVVYEAADKCFRNIRDKRKLKKYLVKKYSLKSDYFLVVGNIENRKLPYMIINSFLSIIDRYKDIQIVFVGPNKLKIKPINNIKILGYVSDEELNILYNGSLSLIYLSLCEGFGLPIIEAMATKTPVICSNIPVLREITNKKAVLVNNSEELLQAMINFIRNKKLRKEFALLGYKQSKLFSWKRTAEETYKIYKWVLENQ